MKATTGDVIEIYLATGNYFDQKQYAFTRFEAMELIFRAKMVKLKRLMDDQMKQLEEKYGAKN